MATPKTIVYPLDEHCTIKGEVLNTNNIAYTCVLNQTDIKTNKNKFYNMQLIKHGTTFTHFIRYGRISEIGTTSQKHYPSENAAIAAFEKQFKSKTKNNWSDRDAFVKKDGMYFLSDIKYEADEEVAKDIATPSTPSASQLDERVQFLIKLFTNQATMNATLVSLEVNTKKMPLGKISKKQLDAAQAILAQIKLLIKPAKKKDNDNGNDNGNDNDSDDSDDSDSNDSDSDDDNNAANNTPQITKLSSEFYTFIPYSSGRKKPPLIDNDKMLEKYADLIEELRNIEVAIKVTKNGANNIDQTYQSIQTTITPMDNTHPMRPIIEDYVFNTHGRTHGFRVNIVDVFQINRHNETPETKPYMDKIGNKHLLWHGSGMVNFCSILKNGFFIDPAALKGVYITGKMFGGSSVYTANSFSKSMGYTRSDLSDGYGALLLCEVALGKQAKRVQADYTCGLEKLAKEGCDSCWGMGQHAPSSSITVGDVTIPNGKLAPTKVKTVLMYDEMIVYNTDQLSIKYLVVVKRC